MRTLNDIVASQIGNLTMQIAGLISENEFLQEQQTHSYELLAQCIRGDQLSAEQVQEVMKDEPFSAWYKAKYPERKS